MSDFAKLAFRSGLWSQSFWGRSDIQEYDYALRQGLNYIVEYESGASVRPGWECCEPVQFPDLDSVLIPYKFNAFLNSNFLVLAGHEYIRILFEGAYVLEETSFPIASSSGMVIEATGHDFVVGDWLKLEEFGNYSFDTFEVTGVASDMVTISSVTGGTTDLVFAGSPTASRIYTLVTPYASTDLKSINFDQYLGDLTLVQRGYAPRILTRNDAADWTLEEIDFFPDLQGPDNVATTPSTGGTAGAYYTVTSLDVEGNESTILNMHLEASSKNITSEEGQVKITWDAVTDAARYNVYRSLFYAEAVDATASGDLGYLGTTKGLEFVDANIIPSFTKTPPIPTPYFTPGAIISVAMDAVGSGYEQDKPTLAVTGGSGTGFEGYPIVNSDGAITSILVLNPGSGYESPTGIITANGTGSGATVTLTALGNDTSNFPQTIAKWRQRRFYGGTDASPIALYASRTGLYNNFNAGLYIAADDAFEDELDVDTITPILHLVPMPTGLFVFTDESIGQVSQVSTRAFSAIDKEYNPITSNGASLLRPLKIDREILYIEAGHNFARVLTPSNLPTYYLNARASRFTPHMFSEENRIGSWCYQNNPKKIIWAQREDGSFISCTYDPEEKMQAWMEHCTNGFVTAMEKSREQSVDRVYGIIKRGTRKFVERLYTETVRNLEEHYATDCSRVTDFVYPDASIVAEAAEEDGYYTFTADSAIFTSDDVGKDIRLGNGRALVSAFVSDTELMAKMQIDPTDYRAKCVGWPQTYTTGEWSLTARTVTVLGLHALEGRTVQILANGTDAGEATVADGQITSPVAASFFVVGLAYEGRLEPTNVASVDALVQHRQKNIKHIHVLTQNARGFSYSSNRKDYYEIFERNDEAGTVPVAYAEGYTKLSVQDSWSPDDSVIVRKTKPFGGTIMAIVADINMGSKISAD